MTKKEIFNKLPSRAVIILRGIPGSGKSTFVDNFADYLGNPMTDDVQVCSADHFWVNEQTGKYEFNIHFLGTAHHFCFENFEYYTGLTGKKKPLYVVVDNTNVSVKEMNKYIKRAKETEWDIVTITFKIDPEVAFKRNIHNVPKNTVFNMYQKLINCQLPNDIINLELDKGELT